MSNFQIIISGETQEHSSQDPDDLSYEKQSGGTAVDRIEDLQKIWPEVMSRLNEIAEQSSNAQSESLFVLDEIEFNIGIEAGLNLGLVTKGTAAVSIKFARRK